MFNLFKSYKCDVSLCELNELNKLTSFKFLTKFLGDSRLEMKMTTSDTQARPQTPIDDLRHPLTI